MLRQIAFGVLVALSLSFVGAAAESAQAAGCSYRLYQDGKGVVTGKFGIQGYGHALKVETASSRVRRECTGRFDRARKTGIVPRTAPRELRCIRTSAGKSTRRKASQYIIMFP